MELRHLRYFVAVAEELHFGRAALRLNLAQPPLSQQIRSLEAELGVALFLRTSRKVELTTEGTIFLDQARAVLMHARKAAEMMQAAGRGEAGRLSIAFVTSAVYAFVPAILREFRRTCPAVEMHCVEMKPNRQIQALRQREVDVGFVRTISSDELFQVETLSREPLVLAIPEEHPMAVRKRVTLGDFAEDAFIFLPRTVGPGFYDAAISSCERAGFVPRIAQEVAEWQTALALVAAGLGVALVPESVKNWQRPGVVYCDLRGETAEIELKLIWRRHELTPVIETFINVARQVARLSQKKLGRL